MISINNLHVEFSAKPLFDSVSFVINRRERIALAGKNGAGKSTMLKIIAGLQRPTSGSVSVPNDVTIGYLPQQMQLTDTLTVAEETRKAFSHLHELERRIADVNAAIAERTDYDSPEYAELIDRLTTLTEQQALLGSDNCEAELEKTLTGLGFRRDDFTRPTAEFSGGWRMRIELAKILLRRPDVLLLDEPTNHLDIDSIQWLERFLQTSGSAVVLVSHDRAFLDNVTTRTIEISLGKIYDYAVSYTRYTELRRERLEQQLRAYRNQQKQIQDTEEFIERFRYKATKAVQVQSRIKQLAKIERIEIDDIDTSHINLRFPPAPRSGDYPIIADGVGKAYGDHQVFSNATFTLRRGEKVAFVGRNGEGKSTMVKCIMGEIPFTGQLRLGHNVKIGYFAQNQAQLLDKSVSVFDIVDRVAVGPIRTRLRDILGAFMFAGDDIDKPVRVLSGGEKTRLAMIRLLLEPVNLLILDEPTNHLDMATKDVLKQAIKEFTGTAIIVSHDREFLDGLVDKVYAFGDGRVREHLGGIYDYLQETQPQPAASRPTPNPSPRGGASNMVSPPLGGGSGGVAAAGQGGADYRARRERDKMLKYARRRVEEAEAEVSRLEGEIAAIEQQLAQATEAPDPAVYDRHAALTRQLENAMSVWELASTELDTLADRLS